MQICPTCGFTQNRDGARFCSNCGTAITTITNAGLEFYFCTRCGNAVESYHAGTEQENILIDTGINEKELEIWTNKQPHYYCPHGKNLWRAHATNFHTTGAFCSRCRIIIEIYARFCGKCGNDLSA